MDFAFSSKAGAAMHSAKSLATSSAVAASTGRLKANTPPKADMGSQASAFRYASRRVSCSAVPQGLLCLMMTAAGRRDSAARLRAASRSTKLLQGAAGRNIESGGLVRIFAIAEFLLAAKCKVEALRENWFFAERDLIGGNGEALEFGGDHAIVAGSSGEDFAG